MLSTTVLALVLGLPVDVPTSAPITSEILPPRTSWTENWAVTLSTGRSFYTSQHDDSDDKSLWQPSHRQSELRVTHQGAPLVVGAAVHRVAYPTGSDIYAIGAGLVLGARHPLLSWLHVEFDGTLGLQKPRRVVSMDLYPGGMFSQVESGPLESFARLGAGVALRVASWLDVPVRLTMHLHPVGESRSLGAASVGLRCLLP
jgi:hypothetical protein